MYLIAYAFSNLIRNKGRNIMLGVILLATTALSGTALILYASADRMVEQYKAEYGVKVLLQRSIHAKKIEPAVLLSFSESTYLHSYTYNAKAAMYSSTLDALKEEKEAASQPKFYIKASTTADKDFKQKTKVIIKGRMFKQGNEVVISKELAELNRLTIGSRFQLQNKIDGSASEYIVSGIYEDLSLGNKTAPAPLLDPANEIYTSFSSFINSDAFKKQGEIESVFYLNQPSDLKLFQKEIKEKGLPAGYEAKMDRKGYEEAIAPAESLQRTASLFVYSILAAGTLFLLLITAFSIRERKYEVGVLRAMGMSRGQVIQILLWETLMICGSCLLLGLGIAAILGPNLGHQLLLNQYVGAEKLSNISFQMEWHTAMVLCLAMLGAGSITSILGIVSIVRFEPRKILSERN